MVNVKMLLCANMFLLIANCNTFAEPLQWYCNANKWGMIVLAVWINYLPRWALA